MAMPNHLVFVRHGESEANIAQNAEKLGEPHPQAAVVFDRPDWQQRLSPEGTHQAKMAKKWLDENLGGVQSFDRKYFSPFARTRETAAYIGGEACTGWMHDDRLVERNWGTYGAIPKKEREAKFALTAKMYKESPWYVRLDGGESRYDVSVRFRDFLATLHREAAGKRVIVVTHGDFIGVARYNLERKLPEEFEQMDADSSQTIRNCSIVHYTRVNPNNASDVRSKMSWLRIVNPVDPLLSPYKGDWVYIGERRTFSGDELLGQASVIAQPLIG